MTPITLERDELTVTRHGQTRGGYDYVCLENPLLVAAAIGQRRHRAMIQEANWRRWG